jgi:hypothetical protein
VLCGRCEKCLFLRPTQISANMSKIKMNTLYMYVFVMGEVDAE